MSTTLLKIAAVTAVSFAAMATSAEAQSRYGDITAYEGSGDCQPTACAPVGTSTTLESSRYGSVQTVAPAYNQAPVVVDCSVFGTPGCDQTVVAQPTTVYTQPVQSYAQQTHSQPQVQLYEQPAMPVNCPAGTTAQPDGTCMQTGSSFGMGTTSSTTTMMEPANCPAGTTAQPDGTCMQTGSSFSMGTMSSTTTMMDCPAGTTKQADGTCAQTGTSYVYEDARPSYGGYDADGAYDAGVYRPIRK